ncbi:MAG: AAA family ATPase [Planctomycetes bacterium]|nr:AAA family ATPase [Planctomycetota bacterium]
MFDKFTDRSRKVMSIAREEAQRFNHEYIGTEHMLLGLIEEGCGIAAKVLKNLDVDLKRIRQEVEHLIPHGPPTVTMGQLPFTPRAKHALELAQEEADNLGHDYIGTEHLLLGLLRENESVAAQVLMNLGLQLEKVREEVLEVLNVEVSSPPLGEPDAGEPPPNRGSTSALDAFSTDLTALARAGHLDPVRGREREVRRLIQILGRRSRNTPVLLGEPGVGRTSAVEALAQAIVSGLVPERLSDHRIVAVDFVLLAASALDRSLHQQRVRALLNEVRRAGNVLLFIDDVRAFFESADTPMTTLAAAALRHSLSLGALRCIVTATPDEYALLLRQIGSLQRRLQPIPVRPLSRDASLEVLRALRERYQQHHRVTFTDDALIACVDLSIRAQPAGSLPGRAIDLLDEAGARAAIQMRSSPRPPALAELEKEIEQLDKDKDRAVADQDFERAALLRERGTSLKAQHLALVNAWRDRDRNQEVVVDATAVAETLAEILGLEPGSVAPAEPPMEQPPPSPA